LEHRPTHIMSLIRTFDTSLKYVFLPWGRRMQPPVTGDAIAPSATVLVPTNLELDLPRFGTAGERVRLTARPRRPFLRTWIRRQLGSHEPKRGSRSLTSPTTDAATLSHPLDTDTKPLGAQCCVAYRALLAGYSVICGLTLPAWMLQRLTPLFPW
jgi:hypothetical protein